ncbi:MAG: hypothetical protein ACF8PG_07590 [Maioricimonas sp. JB045]|uniref:hypothetical protein n=1 Tax=Maioricimonas sp. JC845 TaxID=3232138 RepID=UPI0034592D20
MSQSVTRLSLHQSDPLPADEGVAHRIRHSLFAIRTAVGLIRDRYVRPGECDHLFEILEREQRQVTRLVEQLAQRRRRNA